MKFTVYQFNYSGREDEPSRFPLFQIIAIPPDANPEDYRFPDVPTSIWVRCTSTERIGDIEITGSAAKLFSDGTATYSFVIDGSVCFRNLV